MRSRKLARLLRIVRLADADADACGIPYPSLLLIRRQDAMRRSRNMKVLLLFVSMLCCAGAVSPAPRPTPVVARDYLNLPSNGKLSQPPYVWRRTTGAKTLLVLGTLHLRNPASPMYARMQTELERARPQVILHEGEIPAGLHDLPRDRAIALGADLGYVAQFARRRLVPLRSADAPLKDEITALLSRYSADDVLVFLVAQRLIGSGRKPDTQAIAAQYPTFHDDLVRNGLPRQANHAHWPDFLHAYRRVVGKPFSTADWGPDMVNPTRRTGGRLSDIVRSSEAVRDRHLLAAIKNALRRHDRVAVVFGGWHVQAVEPVLDTMLVPVRATAR